MALVKFGATVAQISGSIGGTVFARNKGGAYARNKTAPVQPNSTLQVGARTVFQAAVRSWTNTLTAGQRDAWNAYASAVTYTDIFGETRYYSGQQRYIQCYCALVNCGGTPTAAAVAPSIYTAATNVTLASLSLTQGAATADATVKITNSASPADAAVGDKLLIHFGGPVTLAANYFNGPYRYVTEATWASGASYPAVTGTDPWARTLASGTRLPIFWRVLKADNRISSAARGIFTLGAHITTP